MNRRNKTILIVLLTIIIVGAIFYMFILSPLQQDGEGRGTRDDINLPQFDDTGVLPNTTDSSDIDTTSSSPSFPVGIDPYRQLISSNSSYSIYASSTSFIARTLQRDSGHVFDIHLTNASSSRISNTTIPRIQNSLISPTGSHIVIQYFNADRASIRTFLGEIIENTQNADEEDEEQSPYRITGSFFPSNITEFDFSPTGERLFYIQETEGGIEGIMSNLDENAQQVIFESKAKEWSVDWVTDSLILLTTSSSGEVEGFSYTLNPATGNVEKIIGDRRGLATLAHPSLDFVLYNTSRSRGNIDLSVLSRIDDTHTQLATKTLSEKCVWSNIDANIIICAVPRNLPNVMYPDAWYRGDISFDDVFWRINVNTGSEQLMAAPEDFDSPPVDAIDLQLTDDDRFLIFRNKKDGSLWSLRL